MNVSVVDVIDHGMWRGRHRWTVIVDGPTGRAQVSATGETEREARQDALTTYRNRRVFTDEERAAADRTTQALGRVFKGDGR